MAARAWRRRCLTSIKVLMVSGFKLARRKEIVSRPPEKMRSTATADPVNSSQIYSKAGRHQLSVQREKMNHPYRPWRPFFNGFYESDPCRNRAVECLEKWPTARARHPWHGCRGTVPTGTGGSPIRKGTRAHCRCPFYVHRKRSEIDKEWLRLCTYIP
jgi:hypothetical protein